MFRKNTFATASVSLLLLLTLLPWRPVSAVFSDVPADDGYAEAIDYVERENIVTGYQDGTYKPKATINRAEFTKIVIGAKFEPSAIANCISENNLAGSAFIFFSDVARDAWFAPYICLAKQENIIGGYKDGTFGPGLNISFVEAAKILANVFGLPAQTDPEIWYRPFVKALATKEAIPLAIQSFTHNITRAEMAEMIYRLRANIVGRATQTYETLVNGGKEIVGTADPRCSLIADPGQCKAAIKKYYFDNPSQTCQEFFWGGCEGVVPFDSLSDCQTACERNSAPPQEVKEVQEFSLSAKTWEFSPNQVTVKKGVPVRLKITSLDVNHGFALPEFDINEKLTPGAIVTVEFTPDKAGSFSFFCSVFCGSGHSGMKGTLVVEE